MTWTIVATSPEPGIWRWVRGHSPNALHAASDAGEIILMQRRRVDCVELVMQPAGPNWRAMQRRNVGREFHVVTVPYRTRAVRRNRFTWSTP